VKAVGTYLRLAPLVVSLGTVLRLLVDDLLLTTFACGGGFNLVSDLSFAFGTWPSCFAGAAS
jgi:hypothetical protein